MHPRLTLEEAIGLLPLDLHGHSFDTCLITILPVRDSGLVALFIAPSSVHPCKHRSPILALCTPCTGIDFQHSP